MPIATALLPVPGLKNHGPPLSPGALRSGCDVLLTTKNPGRPNAVPSVALTVPQVSLVVSPLLQTASPSLIDAFAAYA